MTRESSNSGRAILVGYGTLLHTRSLGQSIGLDAARARSVRPVRVRGFQRLFNLRPDHYTTSRKLSDDGIERAAMNVAASADHHFNGLAFEVDSAELVILDQRERYYRRVPVPLHDFATDDYMGEGHAYSCGDAAPWIERDCRKLMPLWRDIVWARTGAYAISPAFGAEFDATTYLANGRTLVVDQYAHLLDDTSDVDPPR